MSPVGGLVSRKWIAHTLAMANNTGVRRRSLDQSAMVILRMSPEDREALHRVADRHGKSLNAYIREALAPAVQEAKSA